MQIEPSGTTTFLQTVKIIRMCRSDTKQTGRNNFLQTIKILRMAQSDTIEQSKTFFCKKSRSYGWAILLQKKLFSNTFVCNPGSKCSVQINPCVFFPIFRIQHTPVEGRLAGAGISSQFSSDKEDPALCFVCGEPLPL